MALKGSIKEFALTEIFQLIFHQNKEGTLTLTREGEQISVLFKEGKIIRAYEGDYEAVFGEALLKAGLLTNDQLGIVRYRLQNQKSSMEALFIELGFLSESELMRVSRLFTEETLYRLFNWDHGDYEFQQKTVTYNANWVSPLETQYLLMEAVRQIDEWPALLKKIPSREMIFEKIPELKDLRSESDGAQMGNEEDPFGSIDGLEEEGDEESDTAWLLQQLNGRQNVQQIIDRAQVGAFAVHQGIVELLKAKKIQEVKGPEVLSPKNSRLPTKETVLKYLIGGGVACAAIFLFIASYPSMRLTTLRSLNPVREIEGLSLKNEGYFIRFALDLYYLKHNRYPDTLQVLLDEGYFGSNQDVHPQIDQWSYRLTAEGEAQFLLNRSDLDRIDLK